MIHYNYSFPLHFHKYLFIKLYLTMTISIRNKPYKIMFVCVSLFDSSIVVTCIIYQSFGMLLTLIGSNVVYYSK